MPGAGGAEGAAPLRVALVTSSYAPYIGGVEEHVRQVARHLAAQGVEVEVWTVDRSGGHRVAEVEGITVRYLPAPLPARTVSAMARFALAWPRAWLTWKRAYREFAPDVLHVHCFGPNGVYALGLHRTFGVPLGVTSHGETIGDDHGAFRRSKLLRRNLTDALGVAAFVTAPSEYVLRDLRAEFGLSGGDVVPNGVDLAIGPSGSPMESEPHVLGVGRLGRMKGFDLLIDAFAESGIARDHLLLIAGEGPERNALLQHAADREVAARVRLVGRLGEQQVADAMAGAKVVVVPSRSEAFGIVALEAWRSGTALIMTERGGAAEFLRDGEDALLVDPENRAAFAATLHRVVSDDALRDRIAAAGRRRIAEFSWSRTAETYVQLYASA
ncbi:glycosyltransferase family 4 protein [Microbacterium sp.]|uniref:glycosyltransferase family 4 protein n=1 Tax=Microbacterium sp. TaxID=51671 RepID=UPI0037C8D832